MISAVDSRTLGPGLSPCLGYRYCVVILAKTLIVCRLVLPTYGSLSRFHCSIVAGLTLLLI